MPEFKDSVAAGQAEELVTTENLNPTPPIRRRRRHPIGRGNVGGRAHPPAKMGLWDGTNARDTIQERLDHAAMAAKSAEPPSPQEDSKYSTAVIGNPSPHRREDAANQRGRHGCASCRGHGGHAQEKNCAGGKGILRKVLGAIWPFKRAEKGTEEEGARPPQRQQGGGRRYFRPRNRPGHQRSRPPSA
jgi:hypothetical protein